MDKTYLTSTDILNDIRILANSRKFFKDLYEILSNGSVESEIYLQKLEDMKFKNMSEIIKYYE